jgi:hypothetical protein
MEVATTFVAVVPADAHFENSIAPSLRPSEDDTSIGFVSMDVDDGRRSGPLAIAEGMRPIDVTSDGAGVGAAAAADDDDEDGGRCQRATEQHDWSGTRDEIKAGPQRSSQ